MRLAQHVLYYPGDRDGGPGDPEVAHVTRVHDADTVDLDVVRRGALYGVAQCDPATPTAGHWSEVPA